MPRVTSRLSRHTSWMLPFALGLRKRLPSGPFLAEGLERAGKLPGRGRRGEDLGQCAGRGCFHSPWLSVGGENSGHRSCPDNDHQRNPVHDGQPRHEHRQEARDAAVGPDDLQGSWVRCGAVRRAGPSRSCLENTAVVTTTEGK